MVSYVGLPTGGSQPASVAECKEAEMGPWDPKCWKEGRKQQDLLTSDRYNLIDNQDDSYTGLLDPCVTEVLGSIWITNLDHECTRPRCPLRPHKLDEGAILVAGHKRKELLGLLRQLRPFADGGSSITLNFKTLETLLGRLYGFLQMAVRGLPSLSVFQMCMNHMLRMQKLVEGDKSTGTPPNRLHLSYGKWFNNWERVTQGVNSHRGHMLALTR